MDPSTLACEVRRRRQDVCRARRNGIDSVEVPDARYPTDLRVHLFRDAPAKLDAGNVRIDGGRRIRDIRVIRAWVDPAAPAALRVKVDRAGDFSPYTLYLVESRDGRPTGTALKALDPRYATATFTFRSHCAAGVDCGRDASCEAGQPATPAFSYLAKDYGTFRDLILDRLSLVMPEWRERHIPDIGIALVELLAYVGDHLSYEQDAVATEAYLDTARERISVRRHARLVDYHLHEGCNARAWVTVASDQDLVDPALKWKDLYFTTASADAPPLVFEPLMPSGDTAIRLYEAHNTIQLYSWGDAECCLPKGATGATLRDGWVRDNGQPARRLRHLTKGDYLVFEEVIGPKTGNPADADPRRRQVVRLVNVRPREDDLYKEKLDTAELPLPVVDVEWAEEDALRFALCLSVKLSAPDCRVIDDVSVARGNVVLVDHGGLVGPEDLGEVGVAEVTGDCECGDGAVEVTRVPEKFAPVLERRLLTFAAPIRAGAPAWGALSQDPRSAAPQIVSLASLSGGGLDRHEWYERGDLLGSGPGDRHVVVEIDDDGRAHLRFGNGDLGRRPDPSSVFSASYRLGNGPEGNVGADTITTVAWRGRVVNGVTLRARNPLPASGGTAPESLAAARLAAPTAFATNLERAITPDDYASIARRDGRIQGAGAALRWTGSWYAAQVAIDPSGTDAPARASVRAIEHRLRQFRRIGHDLDVRQATYVPLEIELHVCVHRDYPRGQVEASLREVFSARLTASGRQGFFHPDRLTFGDGITVSRLVAEAQSVPGVVSVRVTRLERFGEGAHGEIDAGILRLAPLEVPQLGQDPSLPERGTLTLHMEGGR
jgi:hypothetical protein